MIETAEIVHDTMPKLIDKTNNEYILGTEDTSSCFCLSVSENRYILLFRVMYSKILLDFALVSDPRTVIRLAGQDYII